jgi:hypothetical protein
MARNSGTEMNWYSIPWRSPWRAGRVVAEIESHSSGRRSSRARTTVPLPAPEGPEITNNRPDPDELRLFMLGG